MCECIYVRVHVCILRVGVCLNNWLNRLFITANRQALVACTATCSLAMNLSSRDFFLMSFIITMDMYLFLTEGCFEKWPSIRQKFAN